MPSRITVLGAFACMLANAQAWNSYEYSSTSSGKCVTKSGSGGAQPTPIPTRGAGQTFISTLSGTPVITPSYTRATASVTVTVTDRTTTEYVNTVETVTVPTYTTWKLVNSVFATATWPSTVCNNGVKPKTKTVYTGSYTPVSGQATTSPATYPTEVSCTGGVTSFVIEHPVVTSGVKTETITPTVRVPDYTTTETSTIAWGTETVYGTTITKTTTSYTVASSIKTVRTACEPTYTTTYAAKCAPTNLVRAINNVGLVSGQYADGTAVSYGPNDDNDQYHHDPSLCCQLCQDNKGCGASMWGPGPGACGLYYTPANATVGGAECGEFVLNYQSQEGVIAGQSLILQSGCGLIEYAGHLVPK